MSGELRVGDSFVFDVSTRTQIEVTGRDRVKFLHNFCTNDIKKLQPDQGCEAFVTNVNGKVLGHIFVFAETESLWLESVAGSAAILLPHLRMLASRRISPSSPPQAARSLNGWKAKTCPA